MKNKKHLDSTRNIGIGDIKPPILHCNDQNCPFHGTLSVRGQIFEGVVISDKMQKNIVLKKIRERKNSKYQRIEKKSSQIHAFSPPCMETKIGDIIVIAECRPINKFSSYVVIENKTCLTLITNFLNSEEQETIESYTIELKNIISSIQIKIEPLSDDSLELSQDLDHLANCQRNLYHFTDDIEQLENSIDNFKKAIALTSENSSELPVRFNSLGTALYDLYKVTGKSCLLDEEIQTYESASNFTKKDSPYFPFILNNFANSLMNRYKKTSMETDIEKAINCYKMSLNFTNIDSTNRLITLKNLGSIMKNYYILNKKVECLYEGISFTKEAIYILINNESINFSALLIELSTLLKEYYDCSKGNLPSVESEKILKDVIYSFKKVENILPQSSNNLQIVFNNLGNISREMYLRNKDISDLKAAIKYWRRSIGNTNPITEDYSGMNAIRLNNLAVGLIDLYQAENDQRHLNESLKIWSMLRKEL